MMVNRACFKRHARLLKPAEYSRVFKRATRSTDGMLTILATANGLGYPRLGLAIAKKNARRALDRNRIKRIIRESFRQNQTRLPAIDLVVMAKPQTKSAKNSELFISLEYHWTRLIKQCAKFSSA